MIKDKFMKFTVVLLSGLMITSGLVFSNAIVNAAGIKGWQQNGTKWYYFNDDGAMDKGWKQIGSVWYYFNDEGSMAASKWVKSGASWYYLSAGGNMAVNTTTPDGYNVDSNGVWTPVVVKATVGVSQIKFVSNKLKKAGNITATFQYEILNEAGTDITNEIPASQLDSAGSASSAVTLDPATGIGTITYNSASDVDKINVITIIDSISGKACTMTFNKDGMLNAGSTVPVTIPTSAVCKIGIISPDLKKTGANTATFQYKILDKAGTDITKTIPASQLITFVSVSATINLDPSTRIGAVTLDPSTGIGTVTYKSASDVDKSNTITIIDSLTGVANTKL